MTRRDTTPRRVEADRSVWTTLPRGEKVGAIAPHYAKGRSAAEIAGLLSEAYGCRISRGAIVGVISRNRVALDAALNSGRLSVPVQAAPVRASSSRNERCNLVPASAPLGASRSGLRPSSPLDASDSVAAQPQPARPATDSSAPHTDPVRGGVPFEDLGAGMCRFPLWGDGSRPPLAEMRFCGAEVAPRGSEGRSPDRDTKRNRSWCTAHLAVVAGKEDPERADTRKRNRAIRRAFAQGVSIAALATRHDLPRPTIEGILQARAPAAIVGGLGVAFGTLKP